MAAYARTPTEKHVTLVYKDTTSCKEHSLCLVMSITRQSAIS